MWFSLSRDRLTHIVGVDVVGVGSHCDNNNGAFQMRVVNGEVKRVLKDVFQEGHAQGERKVWLRGLHESVIVFKQPASRSFQ